MLGLVMTLVAATAPALPAADPAVACGDGPGRCELAPLVLHVAPSRPDYATPAVIDPANNAGNATLSAAHRFGSRLGN